MTLKRCVTAVLALIGSSLLLAQNSPTLTLSPRIQAIASPEKSAILGILFQYLTGFSAQNAESLSPTLHPEALITGGNGGVYVERMPFSKLLGMFKTPPAGAGQTRSKVNRTVTDLFIHGDIAAAVVVEEYLPPSRAAGTKTFNTDDAALLEKALQSDTRSWFAEQGKLGYSLSSQEIERIKSWNRRPARQHPEEKRTVVDFAQEGAVSIVTVLDEIPIKSGAMFLGYTMFQLYKADDRWVIVNTAGCNEKDLRRSRTKGKTAIRQRADYQREVEAYEKQRDTEYQEERVLDIVGVSPEG